MIIDTSALSAIFFGEPESDVYIRLIHTFPSLRIVIARNPQLSLR
jgi:uncharacterized protein with PIN domain